MVKSEDHTTYWMQYHKERFFDRPLSRLCLPKSHDAGTYKHSFGTTFGLPENVITQSVSVYDQLRLGVRRFDIRPSLANPIGKGEAQWGCGHYTYTNSTLGWQGANCASLKDVIHDINRFCKESAELIIVEITHVQSIMLQSGTTSRRLSTSPDNWKDLLEILETIEWRWKPDLEKARKMKQFPDRKLGGFIGQGKAAVIVLVDEAPDKEDLLRRGFWPFSQDRDPSKPSEQPKEFLYSREWSVLHMQNDIEAVVSTVRSFVGFGGPASVLSLAKSCQEAEFPKLPQKIVDTDVLPTHISMDRIENLDLLQFCIAVNYLSYYRDKKMFSGTDDVLILYGAKQITYTTSVNGVKEAIRKGGKYMVSNDNFIDTAQGIEKSCVVMWASGKRGGWEREYKNLRF